MQISAGISYNKNGWLISAEGYYKNIDGITTQSQGFQNQYELVKTDGEYDVIGLDALLRKNINNFSTWLSYSYMNNSYTFKELEANDFPSNFDITHAVTVGTAYNVNNLKLSAGLNWHSGKPTTTPIVGNEIINDEINYSTTNTSHLNDYLRVDVSAIYDFKLSNKIKANVGISIWNILDRENQINNFFRVNDGIVNETIQRSLGITPNATFRVFF
jgi:hypothetical protein